MREMPVHFIVTQYFAQYIAYLFILIQALLSLRLEGFCVCEKYLFIANYVVSSFVLFLWLGDKRTYRTLDGK